MSIVAVKKKQRLSRAGAAWYTHILFLLLSVLPLWGVTSFYSIFI
jgi:hypothetical protein